MTWLNPLALLGLLALAVPILVHLFGKRVARRQRFPSLRLLQLAVSTPTTRSQPSDILLLVVRCAVVAAAALALAQPRWTTPGRSRQSLVPSRVVVVDTGASMMRLTSDGRSALEHAREIGLALIDSAREGMVIRTARPGANLAGAASWLESRSGMREVVVISDFQRGAVSVGDLSRVPVGIGLRLRKVATTTGIESVKAGDSAVVARIDPVTDEVDVTWQTPASDPAAIPVTVLVGPADDAAGRASSAAAARLYPRALSGHAVAVVFPGYGASALAGQLESLHQPWQGDFLLTLTRHGLFRDHTKSSGAGPCAQEGAVSLRNAEEVPVATLGAIRGGSPYDIVVFSCAEAGSLAGTALLAAVIAATGQATPFPELEPTAVPDETLRLWERPATEVEPRGRDVTSPDGRWFWLAALGFLLVEEWLRRKRPRRAAAPAVIERQERVA